MSAESNMYAQLLGTPAQGVDAVVPSAIGLIALTVSIAVTLMRCVPEDIGRPASRRLRLTSGGVWIRE